VLLLLALSLHAYCIELCFSSYRHTFTAHLLATHRAAPTPLHSRSTLLLVAHAAPAVHRQSHLKPPASLPFHHAKPYHRHTKPPSHAAHLPAVSRVLPCKRSEQISSPSSNNPHTCKPLRTPAYHHKYVHAPLSPHPCSSAWLPRAQSLSAAHRHSLATLIPILPNRNPGHI
jgi:hypothetical protein